MKEMQAVSAVPPLVYQDYTVDIYIRIYRRETRYDLEIQAIGKTLRFPLDISPQDLVEINRLLQKAMAQIVSENTEKSKPSIEKLEVELRQLADVGHYAYKRIFGGSDAITAICELCVLSKEPIIQVASEDFFIPWELIYPVSPQNALSFEHFWGMNYVISRVIVQDSRHGAFVSPIISYKTKPIVGLLTYSQLPSVAEKESPFFEGLASQGKITLLKLRSLDPNKKQQEFDELRAFLSHSFNIAHFACHASYKDETPTLSHILLSNEFPITLMDLEVYDISISGHPLIVVNACETGNLNPLYTSYFAAAFIKHGVLGVVATECLVPDAFAADFAQKLYSHLLVEKTLGASLLATRKHFLEIYQNPSGLLYSMYAAPNIRLSKIKS